MAQIAILRNLKHLKEPGVTPGIDPVRGLVTCYPFTPFSRLSSQESKYFSMPQFLSNVRKQKPMRDGCFKKNVSIFVNESSFLYV